MKSHIGDLDRELKEVKHQRDSIKSDFSDISEMFDSLSFQSTAKQQYAEDLEKHIQVLLVDIESQKSSYSKLCEMLKLETDESEKRRSLITGLENEVTWWSKTQKENHVTELDALKIASKLEKEKHFTEIDALKTAS